MAKPPVKRNAGQRSAHSAYPDDRRGRQSGPRLYDQQASRSSSRIQTAPPGSHPSGRQSRAGMPTASRQQTRRRPRPAPGGNVRPVRPQPRRLTHSELRRRRRRRNLLMALLGLLVVGVGVVLSLTVLFKVDSFRVENMDGSTPANTGIYTEDAILGALGIPVGENMFQFSGAEKEKSLMVSLPYLERVEIRRRLPSTLVIRVEPAVETWCAQTDSGWLTLSEGLKIMAIGEEQPQGLPALLGLEIDAPVAGYSLQLKQPAATDSPSSASSGTSSSSSSSSSSGVLYQQTDSDPMQELTRLLELLWTYDLKEGCTSIQFGEANELYLIYQNRAKVLLGTFNNLDYKLKFAAYLLHNEDGKGIGDTEQGTLDVSHQLEDGSLRPTWSPGSITETPQPAPSPETGQSAGDATAAEGENGDQTGGDATAEGGTATGEGGDMGQTDPAAPTATPAPTEPPAA